MFLHSVDRVELQNLHPGVQLNLDCFGECEQLHHVPQCFLDQQEHLTDLHLLDCLQPLLLSDFYQSPHNEQ